MDEIIGDFVAESRENLDRVEQELIELEKDPTQMPRIASIFRAIHTVKGTCGFLDLHQLEAVAHSGENLLSILRDGKLAFTQVHATAMLDLVDAVRTMIGHVEGTGKDGEEAYSSLIVRLNALAAEVAAPPAPAGVARAPEVSAEPAAAQKPAATPHKKRGPSKVRAPAATPTETAIAAVAESEAASGSGDEPTAATAEKGSSSPAAQAANAVASVPAAATPPKAPAPAEASGAHKATTTIRVDVAVLDSIMNLVGELVLARNQLLELTNQEVRTPLALTCQRIDQVTTDLQGGVMKTRMQPISTVWNKFPRVARELGVQCGKRVRVDLDGSETELDKTVLEAISEPLAHLIRNSVDHGIEAPAIRAGAGKPPEGRIALSASHQGGHVVIDIQDDGAGINVERITRKAIEKGIITEQQARRMSQRDATNLIFAPGFSTAEKVTNISGRGVGMDVVRTNIERIGGSVDILSTLGVGTTCRVRLPLTLAIVPAIIVASAGQRFAMPQLGLQELVRVRRDVCAIEHVHGAPVYRLRGRLLPLVWLAEVLGLRELTLAEKVSGSSGHILVLQVEGGTFGLVVDEVTNSEEIVVKPMSDLLSELDVYAGTTILGDGQVALILDAANLVSRARNGDTKALGATNEQERARVVVSPTTSYVLCAFSGDSRVAVPLDQVERLEKFRIQAIESQSGRAALQYRGDVIPLFRMEDGLDGAADLVDFADDSGFIHTLIYCEGTRRIGVAVRRILDVVDCQESDTKESGVAVIGQRVTTIADLADTVHRLGPASFAQHLQPLEQAS